MELTTVADDEVVFFDAGQMRRYTGLSPDCDYTFEGQSVRTLTRPGGELLSTVATVNDLHFGETECGVMTGVDIAEAQRVEPGEPPYPETMNRAAAADMAAIEPDAVVAKGDLTAHAADEEMEAFLDCYRTVFGDRLHWVLGNHDVAADGGVKPWPPPEKLPEMRARPPVEVVLPGVRLALLETAVAGLVSGHVSDEALEWLDELGARSDRPVMVFGHHPVWEPEGGRKGSHFGIDPDSSEKLVETFARRPALVGYFAGHTHRNRSRLFATTGNVPFAEICCTKDFPGGWAEYRVYEGGILQIFRRIASSPAALEWSERMRAMFSGLYPAYAFGALTDRCFPIWPGSPGGSTRGGS